GRLFRDGPEWPSVGTVVTRHISRPSAILSASTEVNTGISVPVGLGAGWFTSDRAPTLFVHPDAGIAEFADEAVEWVARGWSVVPINQFSPVFDAPSWDCHADGGSLRTDLNDIRDTVAPAFDLAFSTLLADLAARGLLDSTLVVATGEFGRTPKLNSNGG